jgi:hypothetical protein
MRDQLAVMHESWALVIKYEDVVTRTAATMGKVMEFIAIPYSPIFERPTLFGDDIVVRTASRHTTEIFQPAHDWRLDLTRRERWVMTVTYAIVKLIPGWRLDCARLADEGGWKA